MRAVNLPPLPPPPKNYDQWINLFLTRASDGRAPFPDTTHFLIAYTAWPNDREKRDQYMATNVGLNVAHLERRLTMTLISGPPQAQPMNLSGRSALDRFGGWEAVAEAALSAQVDQLVPIQEKWTRVADIFQVLVDIAHSKSTEIRGGPSISKAIDVVADARGLPGRSQLSAVWSSFRDVAHLLAAGAHLAYGAMTSGEKRASSILSAFLLMPDIVVPLAGAFQQFGLTTFPHGRRSPILDPESLWQIPESHLPIALHLPARCLSPAQIDLLQARRAAKKYRPAPSR